MGNRLERQGEITLPSLPHPELNAEVKRDLIKLADRRMFAPAREAGYELQRVGVTMLPQEMKTVHTPYGTWLFVNHLDDPTADEYGEKLPIPNEQLARLHHLAELGVNPQNVWNGHEMPPTYKVDDPIPRLVPPPKQLREKDQRLALQLATATKFFLMASGTLVAAAAAAPLAVAGGAVSVLGVGLDPIIFGGVRHPELPVVDWCVLAQWNWE
jgi:hypothetical protein